MKLLEKEKARLLRSRGDSYRGIAKILKVSPTTVMSWTNDIELTDEQKRNLLTQNKDCGIAGNLITTQRAMHNRNASQETGRQLARSMMNKDWLFAAGCMLYWAEGSKSKGSIKISNMDVDLLIMFKKFLLQYFNVKTDDINIRCTIYADGLSAYDVESYWLDNLSLPKSAIRKTILVSKKPIRKKTVHPFGICALSLSNTNITQQIFGAIKEFAGISSVEKWRDKK